MVRELENNHGEDPSDANKFISELSPSLQSDIKISLFRTVVSKVPFFAACSAAVVQLVVHFLIPEVFLSGDFIVHAGDAGRAPTATRTRGSSSSPPSPISSSAFS